MESTVVPQALHLLNNKRIHTLAAAFADRVIEDIGPDPVHQVGRVYQLAFSRPPTRQETMRAVALLEAIAADWIREHADRDIPDRSAQANRLALGNLCHAIMNSAEFLYVD
tara:strand:- start:376 stop:708 length:333 start_codon:yes stop_codon:yes gene_type:complete